MSARPAPGLAALLWALSFAACVPMAAPPPDPPVTAPPFARWQQACADAGDGSASWTVPAPPFLVFGNTYYVGTCGITALLVTSPQGHVLLDSGMAEAAPAIAANIESLGFALGEVRWLLSSHEHLDHVGATAELKRRTGARAAALAAAHAQFESGEPLTQDPQAGGLPPFEGFGIDRELADGETLAAGPLAFTAHATPAHTPGSTAWTWRSCEGETCRIVTYADSLSTPAAWNYRFADHPDHVAMVRRGFAAAERLPCGILLTPHPSASGMAGRMAGGGALASQTACRDYARAAAAQFDRLLAGEAAAAP